MRNPARLFDSGHAGQLATLTPEPLLASSFAPFGWVVDRTTALASRRDPPRSINDGTCRRFDGLSPLQLTQAYGEPCLSLFCADARHTHGAPIEITWLERHVLGTQTFIPLMGAPYVVIVALGESEPDVHTLRAFLVDHGAAVTLAASTWHHGLLAPNGGDFVVIERSGPQADCELHALQQPVLLHL